jgi:ABC-type uncharacterized transport system ATPase subunit
MKYQDGTHGQVAAAASGGGGGRAPPAPMSAERREFLEKALSEYMVDFAARMKEIKRDLDVLGPREDRLYKQREQLVDLLTVSDGDRIGVVGINGCGKSTLLRLCNRLLAPNAGVVRFRGVDPLEYHRNTNH